MSSDKKKAKASTVDNADHSYKLSCVQDSQSYSKTLAALRAVEADEILLHDGARGRVLSSKVVGTFHGGASRVLFVSRQYFDQDKGAELLKRLASGSVNAEMVSKYTALAASYCLIRYVENATGLTFADARGSLRIMTDSGGDGSMSIDRHTAKELELIADARSGGQKKSLFGVINHTRTAVGARLLRSTILGPCTDIATIEERLELVTFFLTMEGVFTSTLRILGDFMDLDRTLSDLVTVPKHVTPVTAGRGIATLICLRHTLRLLGPLADTLEEGMQEIAHDPEDEETGDTYEGRGDNAFAGYEEKDDMKGDGKRRDSVCCGSPLLMAMLDNFRDPCLQKILERLDEVLTESTSYSRNPAMMRHQECFAVRPDVDGMLDVSRKTFLQSMEDIYQTADAMTEENGYQVKVACSTSRGYHLVIPAGVDHLPEGICQAVQNVKTISCTTEEVASLSDRANEAVHTALLITHDIVQKLAEEIRAQGLDALFAVTESMALLDMVFGFADLVTLSPLAFCRPEVTANGPMTIRRGRHPIVGAVQDCKVVPNDIHMSPFTNLRVITGPNNSGKSTYLKQAGLTVLMAQMGSYVPAEAAVIPVRDSLLSRIGTGDDMENNMSTFLLEMQEVTQVLIDELGRGTSNREGLAIAWAVAEKLMSSSAYTLFVTHYDQIPGLADLYPNVSNVHLETVDDGRPGREPQALRYLHKAREGRCDPGDGYGIRTAEMCGLPWEIVEEARLLRARVIEAAKAEAIKDGDARSASKSERDTHELLKTLAMLRGSTMDRSALREFLHVLSLEYGGSKAAGILASISSDEADSFPSAVGTPARSNVSTPPTLSAPVALVPAAAAAAESPANDETRRLGEGMVEARGSLAKGSTASEAWLETQDGRASTPPTGATGCATSSSSTVSASSMANTTAPSVDHGICVPSNAELDITPEREPARS